MHEKKGYGNFKSIETKTKINLKTNNNDGFYKSSLKDQNKISTKTFPSNFQKKPLLTIEFLKTNLPPLPLNHPPKPHVHISNV